jgi:hypothetical protein
MPSAKDRQLVVEQFDAARYSTGAASLEEAWLGIYQVLLWYEHDFLHIKESNDLKKNPWQVKARRAEAFIARELGVAPDELPVLIDRMMRLPRWQGKQRNNPLGHGLRMLVSEVLRRWGDPRFSYPEEEPATNWYPGISMPGRSEAPYLDVVSHDSKKVRAIISCKWSYRHDRISDVTNECQEYKAAAVRRQQMGLGYFLVTSEFDPQRLDKVLNQPCVDGLVHVHLDLATEVAGGMTQLMTAARASRRLFDLAEFVKLTHTWEDD